MKKVLSIVLALVLVAMSCCAFAEPSKTTTPVVTEGVVIVDADTTPILAAIAGASDLSTYFGVDVAGKQLVELVPFAFTEAAADGLKAEWSFPTTIVDGAIALVGVTTADATVWYAVDAQASNGNLITTFSGEVIDASRAGSLTVLAVLQ